MLASIGKNPEQKLSSLKIDKVIVDSDLDGMICGAMLLCAFPDARLIVAEARKMQSGELHKHLGPTTAVADLPYVLPVGLHFDHHDSTKPADDNFIGRWENKPSAARVVYDFLHRDFDIAKFAPILGEIDRFDSGDVTLQDIEEPDSWILLGLATDRSDTTFIKHCIQILREYPLEYLWKDSEIEEKCRNFYLMREEFRSFARGHVQVLDGVAFLDHSEYRGKYKISGYEVAVLAPKALTLVKFSKVKAGGYKIGLYRNTFVKKPSELNLLEVARSIESNGGGHKFACGFNTQKEPQVFIPLIVSAVNQAK